MRTPYRTNLERTGERPKSTRDIPNQRKTRKQKLQRKAWEAVTSVHVQLRVQHVSHMLGEACGAKNLGAGRANTVVPVKPAAQKREASRTPFASVPTSRVAGRARRRERCAAAAPH
eukprot:2308228-Prymnesium_polylepis.1